MKIVAEVGRRVDPPHLRLLDGSFRVEHEGDESVGTQLTVVPAGDECIELPVLESTGQKRRVRETDRETINTLRTRQVKNFIATLMLSQGVPMLLGGDEFRRTQRGNNNAYCQDNELSWYDWNFVKKHKEIFRFTRELIAFRKRHPCLRRTHFFSGQDTDHDGIADISWYTPAAHEPDWRNDSTSLACLIDGSYPETSGDVTDNDLYLMFNGSEKALKFVLPKLHSGKTWWRALDTALTAPRDIVTDGKERPIKPNRPYRMAPRSVVVLLSKP